MSKSRSRLAADWFAKLRINLTTNAVEHEDVPDATAITNSVNTAISSISYSTLSGTPTLGTLASADSVDWSSITSAPSAMRNSFDSTAVEGAIKNESGTVSVYASGAWKQIYPAVYS